MIIINYYSLTYIKPNVIIIKGGQEVCETFLYAILKTLQKSQADPGSGGSSSGLLHTQARNGSSPIRDLPRPNPDPHLA